MIVGEGDTPLLFLDLSSEGVRDDSPHLDEFIVHSALDSVDAVLVRIRCPAPKFAFLAIHSRQLPADSGSFQRLWSYCICRGR